MTTLHVPDNPDARRCRNCFQYEGPGVVLPPPTSDRKQICMACRMARMEERVEERKHENFRTFVSTAMAASKSVPTFQRIVQKYMDRVGGLDAFVTTMHQEFEQARMPRVGASRVLDWYKMFFTMFEAATKEEAAARDVAAMSDKELEDAIDNYMKERMPLRITHDQDDPKKDAESA